MRGLYAIIDVPHPYGLDPADVTGAVLAGAGAGLAAIQLRQKMGPTSERVALLRRMGPLCGMAGVPLIVNDDVDAAVAAIDGVVGLHLGQDDEPLHDLGVLRRRAAEVGLEHFVLGRSTHRPEQLRAACREPVDYVAYGPVSITASKQEADPVVGMDGLLRACRLASRPVVAIGGMNDESGARAIELGASAVAVIGALVAPTLVATEARARSLATSFAAAGRSLELDEVAERVPVLTREQLTALATWSDSLGTHVELGLPVRFRPQCTGGRILYRPSDVLDLLYVLDKQPAESWTQWATRTDRSSSIGLVSLRLPQ